MKRINTSNLEDYVDEKVLLKGWLHNLRELGDINFLLIRDRAGLAQAVLGKEELLPIDGLQPGSVIGIRGTVVKAPSAPGGYELHNNVLEVITPITDPLPLPINKMKMNVNQPFFLDHAVIGHRHPKQQAILRLSAGIMRGFREALHAREFVEIQTPKLVASATEGGADVFSVDYFDSIAYLAQSPQFYKQIMVGVFERVYEIAIEGCPLNPSKPILKHSNMVCRHTVVLPSVSNVSSCNY